ncbi:MAG: methyltransferase domain-containing protein [Myxococcota bacterium]
MSVHAPAQDTCHDLEVARRYEHQLVDLMLADWQPPSQPLLVLDLACGTGHAARTLAAKVPAGSRIVALAEDRRRLNALHRSLDGELRRTIFPRRQNRLRLPFAGGAFDLVYAVLGFEQLSPAQAYLTQALRVLRPDGRILIVTPLREAALELIHVFSELLARHVPQERWRPLLTDGGRLEDLAAWTSALERARVSEVELQRHTVPLTLFAPLSRDGLFANVLLPMWLGSDPGRQLELLTLLDRYVTEPVTLQHQVVRLVGRATRTAPEITLGR